MNSILRILAAVVLAAVVIVAPFRPFDSDVKACTNGTGDARIDACTRSINSTRWYHRNDAWAFNNRGNANREKGALDVALSDYSEAIRISPTTTDAYYGRGNIYYSQNKFDLAIADYDRALAGYDAKKYPHSHKTDYLNSRGDAYRLRGDLAPALADYNESIRWEPTQTDGYYDRGLVYRAMKDSDRAIADYSRAIAGSDVRRTPADSRLKYLSARAIAYKLKGEFAASLTDYNEMLRQSDVDTDTFYNRGLVYFTMNDMDRAIGDFDRAISGFDGSRYPASYKRDYLNKRGESYQAKGELGLAIADFDQAIMLDPNFARATQNRAKALALMDR